MSTRPRLRGRRSIFRWRPPQAPIRIFALPRRPPKAESPTATGFRIGWRSRSTNPQSLVGPPGIEPGSPDFQPGAMTTPAQAPSALRIADCGFRIAGFGLAAQAAQSIRNPQSEIRNPLALPAGVAPALSTVTGWRLHFFAFRSAAYSTPLHLEAAAGLAPALFRSAGGRLRCSATRPKTSD